MRRPLLAALAAALLGAAPAAAQRPPAAPSPSAPPPLAAVTVVGPEVVVFTPARDACDGDDVPDTAARAFRTAEGGVAVFAMHTLNRALRGPSLDRLKLDCGVPLRSGRSADPAAYDDASWITATWTSDGRRVDALVHHEFQAHRLKALCPSGVYIECWWNAITAVRSEDGGRSFKPYAPPAVVAAAPFRQEVGQGRHRGFFNPSNIVADGPARYMLASTTGWAGQDSGPCLFRSTNPSDPASWRAYDGRAFTIRYADPYRAAPSPKPCLSVRPFPAPVGAVVRHRPTGAWVAVFQAEANGREFPEPGFYATASRDLLRWDAPRLVLAGRTLYGDPCASGGRLIAYPSLLDPEAQGRNFDDVGASADLWFSALKVEGCRVTSERDLVRRRVSIAVLP